MRGKFKSTATIANKGDLNQIGSKKKVEITSSASPDVKLFCHAQINSNIGSLPVNRYKMKVTNDPETSRDHKD